ncbi:MAG: metallophosphoesterase [Clostridia bacterium]|nr:metallophosphoesterase [Clostridia bacterium]
MSDIHGHYTEMMSALEEAGFDATNEDHIFVSCGDLFDRGVENALVYEFVTGLERKILIRGNHEDMLHKVLTSGAITSVELYNGTDLTVMELLGEEALDSKGCFDREAYSETVIELTAFIDSMVNYYESDGYVFTHGWLPIKWQDGRPRIDAMWREASAEDWKEARLLEWQQFYDARIMLEGKTIVCGHRAARLGHMFDDTRDHNCSEPFYGDGVIAIDAGTIRSGRVNVLVIPSEG